MTLTEQIIELAKEVENQDPIDWGMLNINEDDAYKLLAPSVVEHYMGLSEDVRDLMLLVTVLKLTVENFVLNVKLMQR